MCPVHQSHEDLLVSKCLSLHYSPTHAPPFLPLHFIRSFPSFSCSQQICAITFLICVFGKIHFVYRHHLRPSTGAVAGLEDSSQQQTLEIQRFPTTNTLMYQMVCQYLVGTVLECKIFSTRNSAAELHCHMTGLPPKYLENQYGPLNCSLCFMCLFRFLVYDLYFVVIEKLCRRNVVSRVR